MGKLSGKDCDKLAETGLTLKCSSSVDSPSYEEAELILECRKTYHQDMDPKGFLDDSIQKQYSAEDYHRIYFGEILAAFSAE